MTNDTLNGFVNFHPFSWGKSQPILIASKERKIPMAALKKIGEECESVESRSNSFISEKSLNKGRFPSFKEEWISLEYLDPLERELPDTNTNTVGDQ